MTYATLLLEEGIKSQYLVILKPRRLVSSWTLISGTKYYSTFDHGEAISLTEDGTALVLATSSALSDGDWFWDSTDNKLYFDTGVDPATKEVVATYEIYAGTFDAHWHRIPTDNTKRKVYFEPIVQQSPRIISTSTDSVFGFLPSQSTQLGLSNATHIFEKHVYDSSFNQADVDVYHWLDELSVANIKLIYRGTCKTLTYDDERISISVFDRNDIFEKEYRPPIADSFFDTTSFPNLDPDFNGRPIRQVYGIIDGFVPINIDYAANNPLTTDNRIWICLADETNLGSISTTVPASPASTAPRTYLTSANGFRVGDTAWIDSASGPGFDEYVLITAVNKTGDDYIEHATITNPAASTSVVKRSFVGQVTIVKEGVVYQAKYGRDYSEYTDATNEVAGFEFSSSLEANLSLPSNLNSYDRVYARVYGHKRTATLGGNPFGSDSTETGTLAQAVPILFELLKGELGLAESQIDTTAFTSLQASVSDQIGLALPEKSSEDFPTYKDILGQICQTLLLKIFLDGDNKWTISQTGPAGAVDKTIEDDEILLASVSYDFDYRELIDLAIVQYAGREINKKHDAGQFSYSRASTTSTLAQRLHLIKKQKTFTSLHFLDSEAQTLADRLSYIFGDRIGMWKFSTKNRFFDVKLGDTITVTRPRLPGWEYDSETDRSRNFVVTSTSKGLQKIDIEMDDQKGIQDNSGSW